MRKKGNGKWFGKCRVCGIEKDLCVAHLLPDGLKMIVEDLKRQGTAMASVYLGEKKTKPVQTLPFDKKIICAECDRSFGEIDRKFIAIMKLWANLPARTHTFFPQDRIYNCPLPARAEDLFLGIAVSLLRFSYSSDFPHIQLGKHAEDALLQRVKKTHAKDSVLSDFDVRIVGTSSKMAEGVDLTRILQGAPMPLELEEVLLLTFNLFGLTIFCKSGTGPWPGELTTAGILLDSWGYINVPMVPLAASITGLALEDVAAHHFDIDAAGFLGG